MSVSCRYRCTVCGGRSKTSPSNNERHNLTYSACAHTRGMAEPDAWPMKSSRSGMSALSQICSGRRPLLPAIVSIAAGKSLGDIGPAGRELVVCALAGQQRPCATDPRAIEGLAVGMFAVRVALIPMPGWPARRVHLERGVNHLDRIERCADRPALEGRIGRVRAHRGSPSAPLARSLHPVDGS